MKKRILLLFLILCLLHCMTAMADGPDWSIRFTDANGNGFKGIKCTVCTDTFCKSLVSDADGYVYCDASMEGASVHYTAPEGYAQPQTEATVQQAGISICLAKEESFAFSFRTTYLDGTAADESILAGAKAVLINQWEPWCGPCLGELGDLEALYEKYKDVGFIILGVVNYASYPGYSAENAVAEYGITYPVVNYCDAFDALFGIDSVPQSIFLDSQGRVIDIKNIMRSATEEEALETAQNDVAAYQAGLLERYETMEDYADLMALIRAASEDESKMGDLAEYFIDSIFGSSGEFTGAQSGELWESCIRFCLGEEE